MAGVTEVNVQRQLFDPAKVTLRRFEPVPALAEDLRGHGVSPDQFANVQAKGASGYAYYRAHAGAVDRAVQGAPMSDRLRASYDALTAAVSAQYKHITSPREQGGLGINVEVTPHDPYRNVEEAAADVRDNSRLRVLATETTGGHGLWTNMQNDQFRAVHDIYGHLATGRDFSRHGEEAAYQAHAATMPPEAHLALAGETRGQNSYLNWGGGDFPANVPVELPQWATDPSRRAQPPQPTATAPRSQQGQLF